MQKCLQGEDSEPNSPPKSRRGHIGRPRGEQPKRKAAAELSQNPHTKRARSRLDTYTVEEREVELAKKADIAAISYRLRKYKASDGYLGATEAERARRIAEIRVETTHQRLVFLILAIILVI